MLSLRILRSAPSASLNLAEIEGLFWAYVIALKANAANKHTLILVEVFMILFNCLVLVLRKIIKSSKYSLFLACNSL